MFADEDDDDDEDSKSKYNDLEKTDYRVIISCENLTRLVEDWKEQVCKIKPQFVTITNDNGLFVLTKSGEPVALSAEEIEAKERRKKEAESYQKEKEYVKANYMHILGMELEYERRTELQMGAFHHDSMNGLKNSGLMQFSRNIMYKDDFYTAQLLWNGKTIKQTVSFFPAHWTNEQIMDAIFEAYDEFLERAKCINFVNTFFSKIKGQSKSGTMIEIVIARYGEIVAAYPLLQ